LLFVRVGLYGSGDRKKREIHVPGPAKNKILQAAFLPRKVIGCMRTRDSVDGKREFFAQARNLCKGFVFLIMAVPWCKRSLWF
jgi:hypothetical protein